MSKEREFMDSLTDLEVVKEFVAYCGSDDDNSMEMAYTFWREINKRQLKDIYYSLLSIALKLK